MATSYALPTTAMHNAHSHHGHNHVYSHSHSHTSSRPAANSRSTRHERSTGSLHSSSFSESSVEHNPIHDHKHKHGASGDHSHHSHEPSPLGYPTPPNSDSLPGQQQFERHTHDSHELSKVDSYDPPPNAVHAVGHDHGHHHQHSSPSLEPRSKFTTFILPYTRRWPLLYTIMAEKDSRRIFYFMRYVLPFKVFC